MCKYLSLVKKAEAILDNVKDCVFACSVVFLPLLPYKNVDEMFWKN